MARIQNSDRQMRYLFYIMCWSVLLAVSLGQVPIVMETCPVGFNGETLLTTKTISYTDASSIKMRESIDAGTDGLYMILTPILVVRISKHF